MAKRKYTWGIRTSDSNRTSRGGFQWPEKGWVEAPDWNPEPECGGGLHFLAWGVGDGILLNWGACAIWQVVRAHSPEVIDLGGKSKAPRLEVMFSGDRDEAFILLDKHRRTSDGMRVFQGGTCGDYGSFTGGYRGRVLGGDYSKVSGGYGSTVSGGNDSRVTGGNYSRVSGGEWSTVTGNDSSKVTGGYGSTVAGGIKSTVSGGKYSTVSGGEYSTVTGGEWSTVSGGIGSTITGGIKSTLSLRYVDGTRFRTSIAYVGERAPGMTEGEVIDPGVAYWIEALKGKPHWVRAEVAG